MLISYIYIYIYNVFCPMLPTVSSNNLFPPVKILSAVTQYPPELITSCVMHHSLSRAADTSFSRLPSVSRVAVRSRLCVG